MIILPDRNISRAKILMPMLPREWRTPSQAQPKNVFGHENQFRFCATARYRGRIVWRGWFDDREDFDQFIWAMVDGSIERDHYVQRLPTPWWSTDLGEGLTYEFVTTAFIVSGTSWSVPADCTGVSGQSGEFIDAIGGGGSGGGTTLNKTTGGGAGAWSQITSLVLTPSGSVTIQIGAFGAGVSGAAGNPGTDTWFNGANLAASSVGAKAGGGGAIAGSPPPAGAGGLASAGVGTTKNNGGSGGTVTTAVANGQSTGGGGSGGSTGAGNNGVAGGGQGTGSAGGSGDAGAGGAGGAGVNNANGPTGAGGNGTEYDASHGSGGGSGGLGTFSGPIGAASSAAGGNYGGASGGVSARSTGSSATGAGRPGLIVVAYVPFVGGARSFGVIIH